MSRADIPSVRLAPAEAEYDPTQDSSAFDFWAPLKKVLGLAPDDDNNREESNPVIEEAPKSILKVQKRKDPELSLPITLFCKDADGLEKERVLKITGDLAFEDVLDLLHNEFGRSCILQYTDELGNITKVETDRDYMDMCEAYEDEGKLDVQIKNSNWLLPNNATCFHPRPLGPDAVIRTS